MKPLLVKESYLCLLQHPPITYQRDTLHPEAIGKNAYLLSNGLRIRGVTNVVLAMGAKSLDELSGSLKGKIAEVYVIGDASQPRNALNAIEEGFQVGRKI